jgi:hypothetical protein
MVTFMPYLSKADQRRRIARIVEREKGVKCPELVVEYTTPLLGGGRVEYRCKKGDRVKYLDLTPEQASYVGIDMSVRKRPETGRY